MITWKSEAIVEAGANLHNSETFLFEELGLGIPFNRFADTHFQFVTLSPGQSFWLPYGHCFAMITNLDSRSRVIVQPVISHSLVKKMPMATANLATCVATAGAATRTRSRCWRVAR